VVFQVSGTLGKRIESVAKLLSAGWKPVGSVAALLLWVVVLDALFQTIPYRIISIGTIFSPGFFSSWLVVTPLYAVALWLIARVVRRFPPRGGHTLAARQAR
jgi:hypothetical protein